MAAHILGAHALQHDCRCPSGDTWLEALAKSRRGAADLVALAAARRPSSSRVAFALLTRMAEVDLCQDSVLRASAVNLRCAHSETTCSKRFTQASLPNTPSGAQRLARKHTKTAFRKKASRSDPSSNAPQAAKSPGGRGAPQQKY